MEVREKLKRVSRINRLVAKLPQTEAMQEQVKNFYKKKFGFTKSEIQNLHAFFSPLPVSPGLTKKQVRFCIDIYTMPDPRQNQEEEIIKSLQIAVQEYTGAFAEMLGNVLKRKIWAQRQTPKLPAPSLS